MKYFCLLVLFLANQLMAYSRLAIDDYDRQTGFLFRLMESEQGGGSLALSKSSASIYMNLFIYDPETQKGRNLFQHNTNNITAVMIPSAFNAQKKQMKFLSYAVDIKNNEDLATGTVSEKILVETFDSKARVFSVWTSPKRESKPELLFTYQKPATWHYDAKARMIRVVAAEEASLKVNNYLW